MRKTALLMVLFSFGAWAMDTATFKKHISETTVISQLESVAAGTLKKEEYDKHLIVMERLLELRPRNADIKFRYARANALMNNKSAAFNALLEIQNAGLSYPVGDEAGFENIKNEPVFQYIEDGMTQNGKPFGEGKPFYEVSEAYSGLLLENMVYDKQADRMLLGSVRNGAIYQITPDQKFSELIPPSNKEGDPFGAVDLVIDTEANVLWVASATMPQYNGTTQGNFGSAMVSRYDLSTGKALTHEKFSGLPKPLLINHLTLLNDGGVLLLNLLSNDVLKVDADGVFKEKVVSLQNLKAISALAVDAKSEVLYIADYAEGIYAAHLEKKIIQPLVDAKSVNLSGVDDVLVHEGHLIVIQSGTSPQRVLRIVLDEGVLFKNIVPLEANHPAYAAVTKGAIKDGHLLYFVNSQWDKMDMTGSLKSGASWEKLTILQTKLDYKFEEHMKMQSEIDEYMKKRGLKK